MKRWKKILLAVVGALGVALVVTMILFPQQSFLFAAVVISNTFARHSPPPIAEGQITDKDWLKWDEASKKLSAVLQRHFPLGTKEDIVRSTLQAQGFHEFSPPAPDCIPEGKPVPTGRVYQTCPKDDQWKRSLRYEWGGLPCEQDLIVEWSANKNGEITHIQGSYGGACL